MADDGTGAGLSAGNAGASSTIVGAGSLGGAATDDEGSSSFDSLLRRVAALEAENHDLKASMDALSARASSPAASTGTDAAARVERLEKVVGPFFDRGFSEYDAQHAAIARGDDPARAT